MSQDKTLWIGTSWKMNKTRGEARAFARRLVETPLATTSRVRPFVIPPFTAIADVAEILAGTQIRVGAQTMHWADHGAWTGEISAAMIKDAGATLVELGHSERRTHFGETDETVALKTAAAIAHQLTPLVCIGDTADEHRAGATGEVLARQVRAALSRVPRERAGDVLFAYEPVWSIGEGGTPAAPDFADRQHAAIKVLTERLVGHRLPVLYGGSVNPGNCQALAREPHIDGLFIGRAAWQADGYLGIVEAVAGPL
jgi:triosephosphate isomerase